MSEKAHIRKLIENHKRRKHKLEEQQAVEGRSVDPKIPIEIEDIEVEITELEARLEKLKLKKPNPLEAIFKPNLRRNIINPFHYGGPILPENFVGHQESLEFCHTTLGNPQPPNISVIGERRIGKTSLLHYLYEHTKTETWGNYLCIYLDCGSFSFYTAADFWHKIFDELAEKVVDTSTDLSGYLINTLQKQQRDLTGEDFQKFLTAFYRLNPNQSILLLLDEFEFVLKTYEKETAEDLLRTLRGVTSAPNNRIVLITATQEPLSQFYNNFVPCRLESFDRQETDRVVQAFLGKTDIKFDTQELEAIWQMSQDSQGLARPILVQVAASIIFNHKREHDHRIDETFLRQEFKKQATLFQDSPQPPGSTRKVDYKLGLTVLEEELPDDDPQLVTQFYNLKDQLHQFTDEDDATQHRNLSTTFEELDHIARIVTGLAFDQLSRGERPKKL